MKRKNSAPDTGGEQLVTPAAETIIVTPVPGRVGPLLSTVSGRVTPLAHSAAERINATAVLVTPYAQSAAQRLAPVGKIAAARVAPLAHSAVGHVGPLAQQAVGRVGPYAVQAVGLVGPYARQAQQAAGRVYPLATTATQRGAQAAHGAVGALAPRIDQAWGRVTPAVSAARGRVSEEVLPRLTDALGAAATAPMVVEATKRGKATLAAARGELYLPEPVAVQLKKSWLRRFGPLAAAVGVAGVAAVLAKKSLGHKDADWQAAKPTTSYGSNLAATSSHGSAVEQPVDDLDAPRIDVPVTADDLNGSGSAVPGITDDAEGRASSSYSGEGVYVGTEPPAAFVIKGNERSMKYHTPASGSYNETTAEVWFSSEEAATANGFVRAQG